MHENRGSIEHIGREMRCIACLVSGELMSEVVVRLACDALGDEERLVSTLDAYVEWCETMMSANDDDPLADFMMKKERTSAGFARKLVFRDQEHANRFLVFWNTQKKLVPPKRSEY